MTILLILALAGLMHAARSFEIGLSGGSTGTTLALGYLLLTAHFVGGLFKRMHLPKLTGYIATGIVVGPSVLDFVTQPMVDSLKLVNGVAISLIAMSAGTELEFSSFRPLMRTISWITGVAVLGTTLLLGGTVFASRESLPFMQPLGLAPALMVALVLGVVMVAQSPAVVMAIREEMQADGPVSRTVLGVVVIADLVVIFFFAVTSSVARAVLGGGTSPLVTAGMLGWEIFGSVAAGLFVGAVLGLYMKKITGGGSLFLIAMSVVSAEVGQRLHFDPLLIALTAGILVRNATDTGERLYRQIESASLPVYILFFAVAGANLHLDVISSVAGPAVLFVLVRAVGFLSGTRLATAIAGAPLEVRKYAAYGLLPQAGLALALSMLFTKTFPEFGADAGALTLGVVALNELIAPVIYRWAIVKSDEAGKKTDAAAPTEPTVDPGSGLVYPVVK